ncbi:unnamed protein product [Larinioides sclopetarius]|uniref:Uncharacterized protein n=1 Tax=Larinioides sclopetarius TaxID=280406 RepID=A0AAV2AER6_9ARAC
MLLVLFIELHFGSYNSYHKKICCTVIALIPDLSLIIADRD